MPLTFLDHVNIGVSLLAIIGGGLYVSSKLQAKRKINQLEQIYKEGVKNDLNIKKPERSNEYICIENVMAHFPNQVLPKIIFNETKDQTFANVTCPSFKVVARRNTLHPYSVYKVNVQRALVSQKNMMPQRALFNLQHQEGKSPLTSNVNKILTSASTLGIIGIIRLEDKSDWVIDAKVIGVSLPQIKNQIQDEKFYASLGLVFGGIAVVFGISWALKTFSQINRKRVPLEDSLLKDSFIRR